MLTKKRLIYIIIKNKKLLNKTEIKMNTLKTGKRERFNFLLLQLFVIVSIFIFLFSGEAISVCKIILSKIPLDATCGSMLCRLVIAFKMITHSPSFCILVIMLVHIICKVYNKYLFLLAYNNSIPRENKSLIIPKYKFEDKLFKCNNVYLQNMRLLF